MPIIDFTPEQTISPYADLVKTELAALIEAGEGKATEVKVPTADKGKFKLEFSKSANAAERTARYRVEEPDTDKDGVVKEKGNTRFVITLSPRHKARRGAKTATNDGVEPVSE